MVSVAVLDDGILMNKECVMKKVVKYIVVNKENDYKKYIGNSHGGLCAFIIQDICEEIEFTSISVLDENGRCCGDTLYRGLQICVGKEIDIIHMSLSTRSYFDFLLLRPIIDLLIQEGKIVVAAIDNHNVVSYPAMFPDVFSIYMKREPFLEKDKFGICYAKNMKKKIVYGRAENGNRGIATSTETEVYFTL